MNRTTVALSSKGQLSLPKTLRQKDALEASDVFRLERLSSGKYLLEKLSRPGLPKAKLVRSKEGFIVFRPPKNAPIITTEMVKKLEAGLLPQTSY